MDSYTTALGEVLKEWRTSHGFSMYEMAKFEDMRPDHFARIEKGQKVTTDNLMKYFDFIRCKDPDFDILHHVWVRCGYCSSEEDGQEYEGTVLEQAVRQLDAED